jgi:hypothetical protein
VQPRRSHWSSCRRAVQKANPTAAAVATAATNSDTDVVRRMVCTVTLLPQCLQSPSAVGGNWGTGPDACSFRKGPDFSRAEESGERRGPNGTSSGYHRASGRCRL